MQMKLVTWLRILFDKPADIQETKVALRINTMYYQRYGNKEEREEVQDVFYNCLDRMYSASKEGNNFVVQCIDDFNAKQVRYFRLLLFFLRLRVRIPRDYKTGKKLGWMRISW